MARRAVGAVNMMVTRYSSMIRQKALASGVLIGLPPNNMAAAPSALINIQYSKKAILILILKIYSILKDIKKILNIKYSIVLI